MKTKALIISLAAMLLPSLLAAESIHVDFNAALTNTTEWTYDTLKIGNRGCYIYKSGAIINSPVYDFCITSITINVSTTDSCTRNLIIRPVGKGVSDTSLAREFSDIPKGAESDLTACWSIADQVCALKIESTTGAQNLYLNEATISGVRHVDVPAALHSDSVSGCRFSLGWTNPAGITQNKIYVSQIVEHESSGTTEAEYDFSQFSNPGGNSKEVTAEFASALPQFAGSSLIYLPAESDGVIQISKDNAKGYLVHSGFGGCSNLSIVISAKIPTASQSETFGIGYESSAGATNEFATFNLDVGFATNVVSMADVPDNVPIVFNTEGLNSRRVVHVDCLAFIRDYVPACVETNAVKTVATTGTSQTIRGLKPNSRYLVYVTAFDSEGNESAPSAPVEVETNDRELPFTIRIF